MKFAHALAGLSLYGCSTQAPLPITKPSQEAVQNIVQQILPLYEDVMGTTLANSGGSLCRELHPGVSHIKVRDKSYAVPLPVSITDSDLTPYKSKHPAVDLAIPMKQADRKDQLPYVLPQVSSDCLDPQKDCRIINLNAYLKGLQNNLPDQPDGIGRASGAIVHVYQNARENIAVVLTSAHVFSKSWKEYTAKSTENEKTAAKNDVALFTTHIDMQTWKDLPQSYEIDLVNTYDDLIGKEVEMIVRFSGCGMERSPRILRFPLLANEKRDVFLAPTVNDVFSYYGGVSGSPVFYNGKIVGVFRGGNQNETAEKQYIHIVPVQTLQNLWKRNEAAIVNQQAVSDIYQVKELEKIQK